MQPPLALRFCGLDLVRLRQRREQRLRLGDLGHFRRRRKAFERRREDGVGFGGAAGRLVEFGERQRRAQFEAARALLLRDGDGGLERFFRGRGVGGIALQQHFAAQSDAVPRRTRDRPSVGRRQRFVEDREGAVEIAGSRFGLGKRNLEQPIEEQRRSARAEAPTPRRMSSSPPPAAPLIEPLAQPSRNTPHASPQWQIMLAREPGESRRRSARRARGRRASVRTWPRAFSRKRACRHGRGPRSAPRRRRSSEIRARSISPSGHSVKREVKHRHDAVVLSEAKREIVVAPGSEQGERPFQMARALRDTPRRTNA